MTREDKVKSLAISDELMTDVAISKEILESILLRGRLPTQNQWLGFMNHNNKPRALITISADCKTLDIEQRMAMMYYKVSLLREKGESGYFGEDASLVKTKKTVNLSQIVTDTLLSYRPMELFSVKVYGSIKL